MEVQNQAYNYICDHNWPNTSLFDIPEFKRNKHRAVM